MKLVLRPFRPSIWFFLLIASMPSFAEGTRTWEQSKFEDLSKGTAKGVAIRSAGGLELAPGFKTIATTPSTYVWSVAADRDGTIYAATGAPGRVYRISADGKSTPIFEPQELQVQSLLLTKTGVVLAATNPDGKIYRIEHNPAATNGVGKSEYSASLFFDPKSKYIWDMLLDDAGNLFVATGDQGEIFKVTPKGDHSVFFKSDEAHIRVLAWDKRGNLIAGSDGSGLIFRISPRGEGFVLYSAPKKEITALAVDTAGNIYAAGIGEKRPGALPPLPTPVTPAPPPNTPPATGQGQPGLVISNPPTAPAPVTVIPLPGAGTTGGSEIYRISTDGTPTRFWNSRDELIYALAFDSHQQLLAGTGNRGHIFAITGEDEYSDLVKAGASQITSFASAPNGGLLASSSNLGKVFLLASTPESEGSYESDVLDARIFSRWGRADVRSTGSVELFARSGNVDNPDRNWSPWQKIDVFKNAEISAPPARFVQWKAMLRSGEIAPRVESVTINYLPRNVAPDFDDVTVQVGIRYQSLPKVSVPDTSNTSSGTPQPRFDIPPPIIRDRDGIGVKWTVHDDNDDQMVYSIYYRGEGESRWLLLKDNITDKFYSFDAALLPDGAYQVKVVASDAPSHSPDQALTAEKESARFEVDTTAPQITGLTAAIMGDQLHVTFHAADNFSPIKRAEYSVDAADWQFVEPTGQLSDSKNESYDFRVPLPGLDSGASKKATEIEHMVVVRVYDRYDNMNSAKAVVRAKSRGD
jgi:hypothetical protein